MNVPSLKSASGAGFFFEDKVTAALLAEMLAGQGSLGDQYGITQRIERQAGDWEPFGDLLVEASWNAKSARQTCSLLQREQSATDCSD